MADGFRFRLETVLVLRRRAVEAAQRVVADRLRRIGAIESRMARVGRHMGAQRDAMRGMLVAGRVDTQAVAAQSVFLSDLDQARGALRATRDRHRGELETERRKLIDASVSLKAIEKLKERRYRAYMDRLRRRARRQEDETGQNIYGRRADADGVDRLGGERFDERVA